MNDAFVFIYFFLFAIILGASFAFMWKSMDLMFKELDKPPQKIHPEMRDIKPNDELLVFKIKEEDKLNLPLFGNFRNYIYINTHKWRYKA